MKKCLFFMLAIIYMACSNDFEESVNFQEQVSTSSNVNLSESLISLQNYNDSLYSMGCPAVTRSWGNTYIVAAADGIAVCSTLPVLLRAGRRVLTLTGGSGIYIVGGAILLGTAFLAGGASYAAYRTVCGGYSVYSGYTDYLDNTYNNINHLTACNNFYNQADSLAEYNEDSFEIISDSAYCLVGALHNELLENVMPASYNSPNSNILPPLDPGVPILPSINNYGCAMLTNTETEDALALVSDNMLFLDTSMYSIYDQLDFHVENNDISSNVRDVLSLFFSAYINFTTSPNDVDNLVSYYHNIVSNSMDYSPEEKACIILCIEITKSSFSYWNEYSSN